MDDRPHGGSGSGPGLVELDTAPLSRAHWRNAIIASLGDFLDFGGIVAGSASFVFWEKSFHLQPSSIGLIAALGANGISSAIGAFIGGKLTDRYGRKAIYTYDLLLFMFATLFGIFAANVVMVIIGYSLMGFAIGIDIPASWTLVAEIAPKLDRRRLLGVTVALFDGGAAVIYGLASVLSPLGELSSRLLFVFLFLAALVTWFLRHGLSETVRWERLQKRKEAHLSLRDAMRNYQILPSLIFALGLYSLYVLPGSMGSDFLPYTFHQLHITGIALADAIAAIVPTADVLVVIFLFMPLSSRIEGRYLFALGSLLGGGGWLFLRYVEHISALTGLAGYVVLVSLSLMGQPFLRVWSVELFPTEVRATAQSVIWGGKKLVVSVWSYFVPKLVATTGLSIVVPFIIVAYALQALIGGLWAPRTLGKSLEELVPLKQQRTVGTGLET